MTIPLIKADILSDMDKHKKTLVLHGCNCMHTMGAGIAAYLRMVYPQVFSADCQQTKRGDRNKLGLYSTYKRHSNFHILNCYTQYGFSNRNGAPVDYAAIEVCFERIALAYKGWAIRMPQIGCGLAGGDWKRVESLVEQIFVDFDVKVYYK